MTLLGRSLGLSSPLCILELSRPTRVGRQSKTQLFIVVFLTAFLHVLVYLVLLGRVEHFQQVQCEHLSFPQYVTLTKNVGWTDPISNN